MNMSKYPAELVKEVALSPLKWLDTTKEDFSTRLESFLEPVPAED
jgi:hypothetical protein